MDNGRIFSSYTCVCTCVKKVREDLLYEYRIPPLNPRKITLYAIFEYPSRLMRTRERFFSTPKRTIYGSNIKCKSEEEEEEEEGRKKIREIFVQVTFHTLTASHPPRRRNGNEDGFVRSAVR